MNPAGHAGGHHHQPQPKWSLQMILMVNHWAASGRAAAKLKQDELNEVQQDKKQSERASSVLSVGSSSRHDTFFGKTLVDWIIQEYDEERDNSIQYGRQMILAGVIQNPSGAASIDFDSFKDDFSAFSLTSSFQRLMKIGKYQDSPKPSSSRSNNRTPKTTDQLEKIACIFREPPPNPSEIDVDTRNFIEEGLHFFSPPTFDKRLQEQLVSGIITMVGVISHITPPLSLPDDITGPPVLQIGTANFILINLTNIEEENTYLILSLPDHLSERQIRILGEDFQNNMRFLQGPFKVLAARLPEALLKKEVERTGTDLVQTMNISSTAMPIVPYTKSQTSILAYRLGSKCGQSTLGAYMKASHLVDKMMTRKGVLSAAVFNEGKVAAHEMTEELLKLIGISILEKASKVNDKGWSNNSDDNLPYLPQGFSNIRFDPLRYGLSLRHEKSSSNDTSDLIPIYLTKKQAEEFKGCDTEDTPSTLLPNYFKQNNDDGGKWFGLYLQHKELMCCVMIVPIKQLFGIINSSIDKQFRSVLAHSMAGLIQQGTVPQSVAPAESGSYAIWNQIDESFISNNSSTAFTSECAFAHFTIDDLKDEGQEVNRIILSKGPNSQYFAARNTANIKSFFETSQAGGQRSMSHTEEKAKEQIGVYPCLL